MSRGGGSAGTLTVTVGAETTQFERNMRAGEAATKRFESTTVASNRAVVRSWEAIDAAQKRVGLSMGRFTSNIGRMAGGLTMLSGAAGGAANTIGGALTRSMGAFMLGGPIGLGFQAIVEGVSWLGRDGKSATDRAAESARRYADEMERVARAVAESRGRIEGRGLSARAESLGVDADFLGRKEGLEAAIADREKASRAAGNKARLAAEAVRSAESRVQQERSTFGVPSLSAQNDLKAREAAYEKAIDEQRKAEADLAVFRMDLDQTVAEHKKRVAKKAKEDEEKRGKEGYAEWKESQSLIEAMMARLTKIRNDQLESAKKAEESWQANREKVVSRMMAQLDDAEASRQRTRSAMKAANESIAEAEARRMRDMQATTEMQRLQNRHADELAALLERQVDSTATLARQAAEVAALKRSEALAANAAAEATMRQAEAQRQAAHAAAATEERVKRAAAASARSAQLAAYGSGYGPLAMARDARRFSRNVERGLRHEANLGAERRESMAYGTVGAPQWTVDAAGNLARNGLSDPFASDLGSLYNRPRKETPIYDYAAPGLLMPPPPLLAEDSNGRPLAGPPMPVGGGEVLGLGAAGGSRGLAGVTDEWRAAATKAGAAGDAADEAADEVTRAASEVADGAGGVADGLRRTADGVERMADAYASIRSDVDDLKERVEAAEAAAFLGG